jgi:hypothetical protein
VRRRIVISRALLGVAFLLVLGGYLINRSHTVPDTRAVTARFHGQLVTENLQSTIAKLVERPDRPTEIADLPADDGQKATRALAAALVVYPKGFVDKRVSRIALAGQITMWQVQVGGFFAADTIALNAHDVAAPGGETFLADSFHHELSSILRNEVLFNVSDWTADNPPGFSYASMDEYKTILLQRPPVEGDARLHAQGFVSLYGTTSLDNDWNTYAERVFGHGRDFASEIATFPRMRDKTRQLLDIYVKADPRLEIYFLAIGLRQAVSEKAASAPAPGAQFISPR